MTNITGFEQFAEEVRFAMEKRYPEDRVELKRVTKNNGVIYTGITIVGKDENIYPTMYLEPFYEENDEGALDEALLDRMCSVYESRRVGSTSILDFPKSYDEARKNLRCKLINYKSNEELLKDVPHRLFMDLAIVPYYIFANSGLTSLIKGEASFIVRRSTLKLWDVSEEELIKDSMDGTFENEHPSITAMYDMLKRLNPALVEDTDIGIRQCPMYVMTTEGSNGAVSMLYEEELKEFSEKIGKDLFVIPSSINEIILVPDDSDAPARMLNEMIKEINDTQLEPVDVLSDHVYYFVRGKGYEEVA